MSPSKLEFTRDMSVLFNQKYFKEAKKNYKGWLSYITVFLSVMARLKYDALKVLVLQAGTVR